MGAGARMAEERDRWADHWKLADLDPEVEHLLDLLTLAGEELRAAVPGLRGGGDGEGQVLIGVTDQRLLVVGRAREATTGGGPGRRVDPSVVDLTSLAAMFVEGAAIEDGRGDAIALDLDDDALDRLRGYVSRLPRV